MSQDPWAHRGENMRCRTCMWFVPKLKPNPLCLDSDVPEHSVPIVGPVGRCRRHAPTMHDFPAVFETDWCGDHKIDETKL